MQLYKYRMKYDLIVVYGPLFKITTLYLSFCRQNNIFSKVVTFVESFYKFSSSKFQTNTWKYNKSTSTLQTWKKHKKFTQSNFDIFFFHRPFSSYYKENLGQTEEIYADLKKVTNTWFACLRVFLGPAVWDSDRCF